MKIPNDIKAVHRSLSNTNVQFLGFVEKNPDSLKRSHFNLISILLNHVIESILNNSLDNNGEIIIALAIPMEDFKRITPTHFEVYINHLYRRELNKKDNRLRGEVIICDDKDLSGHAGQWARILPKVDSKGIINCAWIYPVM